jgi:hypothetical protein
LGDSKLFKKSGMMYESFTPKNNPVLKKAENAEKTRKYRQNSPNKSGQNQQSTQLESTMVNSNVAMRSSLAPNKRSTQK